MFQSVAHPNMRYFIGFIPCCSVLIMTIVGQIGERVV